MGWIAGRLIDKNSTELPVLSCAFPNAVNIPLNLTIALEYFLNDISNKHGYGNNDAYVRSVYYIML